MLTLTTAAATHYAATRSGSNWQEAMSCSPDPVWVWQDGGGQDELDTTGLVDLETEAP